MKRAVARNRPHQKNDYRAAGTRLRDQTERSEERGAGRGERRPRARPERLTRLDQGPHYAPALLDNGRALFCARGRSPRGLKCARNLLERREGEALSGAGVKATCKEDARAMRACLLCSWPQRERSGMPNLLGAGRGANAPRLLGGAGGLPPARTRGGASIATVFKAGGSLGLR